MKQKLTALLLVSALFVSLSACGLARSGELPTLATEAPTQTQTPTEPAPTVPELDYDNLVITTETFVLNYDGFAYTFRIPKVNCDTEVFDEVNQKIYDELYPVISKTIDDAEYPESSEVDYEWYYNDEVLSIVVHRYEFFFDWTDYYVYNIDLIEGRLLSNLEFLSCLGMSPEEYVSSMRQSVAASWLSGTYADPNEDEFAAQQYQRTIESGNVQDSVPFLGADGLVWGIVKGYSLVDADYYFGTYSTVPAYPLPADWETIGT